MRKDNIMRNINRKTILNITLIILVIIIFSPLLLCGLIFWVINFIVCFPIDYSKYKKSSYYKKFKERYYTGIMKSDYFKFYSYIEENNLNIKCINKNIDEKYLRKNNTVYLFPWFNDIEFDLLNNCIIHIHDGWEGENLKLIISEQEKKYNCKVKVIIKENMFKESDICKAYNCDLFFVYKQLSDLKKI